MVDRYADGVIGEQPNLDPERLEEIRASIRVEAERASQEEPDDESADRVRLAAPDVSSRVQSSSTS